MSSHARIPRVLVLEDSAEATRLPTAYLVSDGYEVIAVWSEDEALASAERAAPDLALLGLGVRAEPDGLCERIRVRARRPELPVILAAPGRVRAENWGADEVVTLPYQRTELLLAVRSMLRIGRLRVELEECTSALRSARSLLRRQAITDPLTGLYHRGYGEESLGREVDRARRQGGRLAVIVLIVDGLRRFNEVHGPRAGDRLLIDVARLIRQHVPEPAVAARFGDKRFVLVLPESCADGAEDIAGELRNFILQGRPALPGGVRIDLAVVRWPDDAADARSLLRAAERRLHPLRSVARAAAAPPRPG